VKQNLCDLCNAPVDKPGHPVFLSACPAQAGRSGDVHIEVILRSLDPKKPGILQDTCPSCLAKLFATAKLPIPPPAGPAPAPVSQGPKAPA
jgi:hypothetical protein